MKLSLQVARTFASLILNNVHSTAFHQKTQFCKVIQIKHKITLTLYMTTSIWTSWFRDDEDVKYEICLPLSIFTNIFINSQNIENIFIFTGKFILNCYMKFSRAIWPNNLQQFVPFVKLSKNNSNRLSPPMECSPTVNRTIIRRTLRGCMTNFSIFGYLFVIIWWIKMWSSRYVCMQVFSVQKLFQRKPLLIIAIPHH